MAASNKIFSITDEYDRKDRARRKYVYEGWSLEKISEKEKIPISTLKSWSKKYEWVEDRKQFEDVDRRGEKAIIAGIERLAVKAEQGDDKSIKLLMQARRELRHDVDPLKAVNDFASALITSLLNDGHEEVADLTANYFELAVERMRGL